MYKKKVKEVMYLEGGDCIKIYWSSLGIDYCILGYNYDQNVIIATSLKDGSYFNIPRTEHGVTIEAIKKAGGMPVEYVGKLKSIIHDSYLFVKEEENENER